MYACVGASNPALGQPRKAHITRKPDMPLTPGSLESPLEEEEEEFASYVPTRRLGTRTAVRRFRGESGAGTRLVRVVYGCVPLAGGDLVPESWKRLDGVAVATSRRSQLEEEPHRPRGLQGSVQ